MPYSTKEKAREHNRLYYARTKDRYKEYHKITRLAQRAHPIAQPCSVDGCTETGERHHEDYSKPTEIVWLCRTHHRPGRHAQVSSKKCISCAEMAYAKERCPRHYYAWRQSICPRNRKKENEYAKAYREAHRDEINRKAREYKRTHRDLINKQRKALRLKRKMQLKSSQ
jgi:hypothetical protein